MSKVPLGGKTVYVREAFDKAAPQPFHCSCPELQRRRFIYMCRSYMYQANAAVRILYSRYAVERDQWSKTMNGPPLASKSEFCSYPCPLIVYQLHSTSDSLIR